MLRLDVRRFFPSIDHALLREELDRTMPPDWRWLRDRFLDAPAQIEQVTHWFPGDDLLAPLRPHGLPIGSLTSELRANLHLSPLDRLLGSRLCLGTFVRSCHDLVLYDDDPARLRDALCQVQRCASQLRLVLHPGETRLHRTTRPVPFLGFVLRRTATGVSVRLQHDNVVRMRARLRTAQVMYAAGALSLEEVTTQVRAWLAHAAHGDTRALVRAELARLAFVRGGDAGSPERRSRARLGGHRPQEVPPVPASRGARFAPDAVDVQAQRDAADPLRAKRPCLRPTSRRRRGSGTQELRAVSQPSQNVTFAGAQRPLVTPPAVYVRQTTLPHSASIVQAFEQKPLSGSIGKQRLLSQVPGEAPGTHAPPSSVVPCSDGLPAAGSRQASPPPDATPPNGSHACSQVVRQVGESANTSQLPPLTSNSTQEHERTGHSESSLQDCPAGAPPPLPPPSSLEESPQAGPRSRTISESASRIRIRIESSPGGWSCRASVPAGSGR